MSSSLAAAMDFSSAAITFEYVIWLVWLCLSGTSSKVKHPIYGVVFPALDVLDQFAAGLFLTFATGLLDMLQSDCPPSIDYFKGLPSDGKGFWGVYALVLEKPGCPPLLYIGSGTSYTGGVHRRFTQYQRHEELPKYVIRALSEGYTISHVGLLAWCPIPTSARLRTRVFFLALEATFSTLLWATNNRDKSYGMPLLCKWTRASLRYAGLISHSPLIEGIRGEDDSLTSEEIEVLEIEFQARRQLAKKVLLQKRVDFKRDHFAEWQATRRRYWANRDLELYAATRRRTRAKALKEERFACKICGSTFADSRELNIHNLTPKHVNNVAGTRPISKAADQKTAARRNAAKEAGEFRCKICPKAKSMDSQYKLDRHYKTKKHIGYAAAAKSKSSPALG